MRWSGATGALARCKRVSTGCGRKSRAVRAWRWICGVKPTPKAGHKPLHHFILHGLDKPGSSATVSTNIGSGGWGNIVEKYMKAKAYCDQPFEVIHHGKQKIQVPIPREWIGDRRNGTDGPEQRKVALHCESATLAHMAPASLDAVFTDPPYFGNVQYAELMDFCYVWLRRLVGQT